MALSKQIVSLPFEAGINGRISDKLIRPPFLDKAENAIFELQGQARKRSGMADLGTSLHQHNSEAISRISSCMESRGGLCLYAQTKDTSADSAYSGWEAMSWDSEAGAFVRQGYATPMEITTRKILTTDEAADLYHLDMAVTDSGKYAGICYQADMSQLDHVRAIVYERATGTIVLDERIRIGTGSGASQYDWPRVAAVGEKLCFGFSGYGDGDIKLFVVDTASDPSAWPASPLNLFGDVGGATDNPWDMCAGTYISGTSQPALYIAYKQASTTYPMLRIIKTDGTVLQSTAESGSTVSSVITIAYLTNHRTATPYPVMAWQRTGSPFAVYVNVYSAAGIRQSGPTVVYDPNYGGGSDVDYVVGVGLVEDPSYNYATAADSAFRVLITERLQSAGTARKTGAAAQPTGAEARAVASRLVRFSGTVMTIGGFVTSDSDEHGWGGLLAKPAATYSTDAALIRPHWWVATDLETLDCEQKTMHMLTPTGPTNSDIDAQAHLLVNRAKGWINGRGTNSKTSLPRTERIDDQEFAFPAVEAVASAKSATYGERAAYSIHDVTVKQGVAALGSAELGGRRFVAEGGRVAVLDGRARPVGTGQYPEILDADVTTSGGSVADGDYLYRAVYEWTDQQGQYYQSRPSDAFEVTVTGGSGSAHVDLAVTMPHFHTEPGTATKHRPASIALYRTQVNPGANPTYYRVTTAWTNSSSGRRVQIADTQADSSLADVQQLYAVPGEPGAELDHIGPPACSIIAADQQRIYIVPSDDPESIWYSIESVAGRAPVFSDFAVKRVDAGGPTTGLAVLGDFKIVFKADQIRVFSGAGPLRNGTGPSFSADAKIASIGCSSWRSVVVAGDRVFFANSQGIFSINRGLQVEAVGEPVQRYKGETIIKAVDVPSDGRVLFFLADTAKTVLCYDYRIGQWTTWDMDKVYVDACPYDGGFAFVTSGDVYQSASTYQDDSAAIRLRLKTGWINLSGLQGYQRIYQILVMGEWRSPHTLYIRLYSDYSDTADQTITVGMATDPGLYQIRVRPQKQRCQALSIEVYDSNDQANSPSDAADYEGYRMDGIDLEIGVDPRRSRDPAASLVK